jgi:acetyl-CoA C-acetyltransferase
VTIDPRTPVIAGGGQVTITEGDAPEPLDMMAEAARRAESDTGGTGVLGAADAVAVVRILSRRYGDPGAQVAEMVGARPRATAYSSDGGDTPMALVAALAERIQAGQLDVAIVGGAEAWRTRRAYRQRGVKPPWPPRDRDARPGETFGKPLAMGAPEEHALGLLLPVQLYPVFENALRAAAGRRPADHMSHIAALWARFSEVAAANPYAALRRRYSPAEISTVTPDNRMVCYPYTKLLNSNSHVDQAAALVVCGVGAARRLGIPAERWVFLHGAATASDTPAVGNRWDLASSPAIAAAGQAALAAAGMAAGDAEEVDLYSCFPSAVQVAAAALGLDQERQLTVTGGLTFAGGPWNNYATHALATMVGRLRQRPEATGLCTANGGLLTKHAVGVLAARPPSGRLVVQRTHPQLDSAPTRVLTRGYHGRARLESFTVAHARDGTPERAFLACLLPDGRRAWATSVDAATMTELEEADTSGRLVEVDGDTAVLAA